MFLADMYLYYYSIFSWYEFILLSDVFCAIDGIPENQIKCSGKHWFLGEDGVHLSGLGNDVFWILDKKALIVNIWV